MTNAQFNKPIGMTDISARYVDVTAARRPTTAARSLVAATITVATPDRLPSRGDIASERSSNEQCLERLTRTAALVR
jgi:hypothetical protein